MCSQCVSEAELLMDEVLPGYALMLARKDSEHWASGQYALVEKNDPDFIWSGDPLVNPLEGLSDQEVNALEKNGDPWRNFESYANRVDEIEHQFRVGPFVGYKFVRSCRDDGYDPGKHGERVLFWFVDHIARKLKRNARG